MSDIDRLKINTILDIYKNSIEKTTKELQFSKAGTIETAGSKAITRGKYTMKRIVENGLNNGVTTSDVSKVEQLARGRENDEIGFEY